MTMLSPAAASVTTSDFGESFILEIAAMVVLIVLFVRYVLPPLRRAMNGKTESIRAQLSAGDEARAKALELVAVRESELNQARAEVAGIVQQARASTEQLLADGRRRADVEYQRIVGRVDVELALERAKVRDDVIEAIGDLVARAVTRVVVAELNERNHHRLIMEAITATESEAAV
jgi:ATP synthase F0 subunit b